MYNRYICPFCGAHLDPGEPCDCRDGVTEGIGEEPRRSRSVNTGTRGEVNEINRKVSRK